MVTVTAITMTTDGQQLQLLLAWMSPAFPIGGFAYSHGLEFAIEDHQVTDAGSLRQWIEDVLTRGSSWNDAVLFARCWEDDTETLNELALALAGSRERYLETTSLGNAFLQAASMWQEQEELPLPLRERGRGEGSHYSHAESYATAYPIAAGSFCHAANIDRRAALLAYLQSFASALISVAVRLIPLGQSQGLTVLRDLMPAIAATAAHAETATLEDLGSVTLGADIAAMKHETQYSRVFRT
jgi:urease accessory protein